MNRSPREKLASARRAAPHSIAFQQDSIKYSLLHSREMTTDESNATRQLVYTYAHRRASSTATRPHPLPCVALRRTPSPPGEQRERAYLPPPAFFWISLKSRSPRLVAESGAQATGPEQKAAARPPTARWHASCGWVLGTEAWGVATGVWCARRPRLGARGRSKLQGGSGGRRAMGSGGAGQTNQPAGGLSRLVLLVDAGERLLEGVLRRGVQHLRLDRSVVVRPAQRAAAP